MPIHRFAAFVSMICLCASALAAPFPIPRLTGTVTDSANLLDARSASTATKLTSYQARSGHQIVVLVVPTIGAASSIEEYAVAVFGAWQLGRAGKDDGVLLVVAVNDRKVRIEVGYGLEGELTDAKSSRIIREKIVPRFADGDLSGGIEAGVSAILSVLEPGPLPVETLHTEQSANAPMPRDMAWALLGCLILPVMIMALFGGGFSALAGGVPVAMLTHYVLPDWRGYAVIAVILTVWCYLRWRLIAKNVRKYYLPKSRFKTLTWLWRMSVPGFSDAPAKPKRKGKRTKQACAEASESEGFWSWKTNIRFSFEFSDSSGSSGDASDTGGSSGGGGASGKW